MRGLGVAAVTAAVFAVIAFGPAWLLLTPVPAAVAGVLVYGALVGLTRPPGLREAWSYLHALS